MPGIFLDLFLATTLIEARDASFGVIKGAPFASIGYMLRYAGSNSTDYLDGKSFPQNPHQSLPPVQTTAVSLLLYGLR